MSLSDKQKRDLRGLTSAIGATVEAFMEEGFTREEAIQFAVAILGKSEVSISSVYPAVDFGGTVKH